MLKDLGDSQSYKYPLYDYDSCVYQGQREWSLGANKVYRYRYVVCACVCVCRVYPKLYVHRFLANGLLIRHLFFLPLKILSLWMY